MTVPKSRALGIFCKPSGNRVRGVGVGSGTIAITGSNPKYHVTLACTSLPVLPGVLLSTSRPSRCYYCIEIPV